MAAVSNSDSLYLGSFDSERFWRDPAFSQLPSIPDAQADTIVAVMDELMFASCHAQDGLLITRSPMDSTHADYLRDIGFRFTNNEKPLASAGDSPSNEAICRLLQVTVEQAHFRNMFSGLKGLVPYSVLPSTGAFCQHYGIAQRMPDIESVRKANSKLFSHSLEVEHLDELHGGEAVHSAAELETVGMRLLGTSPLLIKDDFGVSGKGNLLVDSVPLLQRIVRHIGKQERACKQTRFLLEPLLDKELDFSCQLEIGENGGVEIVSVQKMENAGFAFSAIQTADTAFMERLCRAGYLDKIQVIAVRLYREGYFGPVCVDSMLLKDGSIRTVVEINARQSMGFINHYIDRFLAPFSTCGSLLFFSLGLTRRVEMEDILQRLQQENILFLPDRPEGILPLSANTLTANWNPTAAGDTAFKGRFYVSIVATSQVKRASLKEKMQQVFAGLGIKVFTL